MAFTSLNHYLDAEWMEYAFECTRKDGAVGIDGVTGQAYAENLQQNLADLIDRIKSGRYRALPVRAAEARRFPSAIRRSCATVGDLAATHPDRRRLISGRTSSITAFSAMALPRAESRRSSSCAIVSPSRPTSATRTFLP